MDDIFPDVDKSKIDEFYKKIGENVKNARKAKGIAPHHFYQTVKIIKTKTILI